MKNRIHQGVRIKALIFHVFKAPGRYLLSKNSTFLVLTILLLPVTGITQTGQSSDDAMFIDSKGHVGIGTKTPQAKLDVAGDTRISNQLEIKGDTKVSGQLDVAGDTSVGKRLVIEGDTKVGGQLDVTGDTKIGGQFDVSGNVQMQGNMSYRAIYQRDDEPESFYEITPRYHLSLTGATYGGKTKTIPQEVIEALCADPDGCQVRLAMTRWTSDVETESASVFFTFYYSAPNGRWRASHTDAASANGVDGNKVIQHVRNIWDTCFFTDGTYSGYEGIGDDKKGMQLLVWKKYKYINRTCECTIID